MNYKDSIEKTKQGFESSFESEEFYDKQTKDEKHLEMIMNYLNVKAGMKILDLGTGTGYLAFPFAQNYPDAEIIGLDIVKKTLEENCKKADKAGLKNVKFVSYEGLNFPFPDNTFDIVMTRYALHHFPEINNALKEISRVLKTNGILFLSDPAPNDNDTGRFVDAYMQMKKDGHIKFYTKSEWKNLGNISGLCYMSDFETAIRFPRKKETALEFSDILRNYDDEIIKGYDVEVIDDEIWITEKVNNMIFSKK